MSKPTSLSHLKKYSRMYYKRLKPLFCPILNEYVHFTSEGYFHLINESHSKCGNTIPRKPSEQYMKLKCLNDVGAVLKYSTRIAERRKVRKKVKNIWKSVIQTEIVHEIKGRKISVITEKVGDGKTKFLSLYFLQKRTKTPPKGYSWWSVFSA